MSIQSKPDFASLASRGRRAVRSREVRLSLSNRSHFFFHLRRSLLFCHRTVKLGPDFPLAKPKDKANACLTVPTALASRHVEEACDCHRSSQSTRILDKAMVLGSKESPT